VTGRVKAALVDAQDLYANAFKITTERGTAYMMGRVTQTEAKRATDVVRGVSGVKRVVRVFDYITDDELRAMQPKRKVEPTVQTPVMGGAAAPQTSSQPVASPVK
jgi:hypothetical protein